MSLPMSMIRHARVAAAAAALAVTVSCASGPKPNADLVAAHTLVSQAEQSGAQQYASASLEAARSELRQADQDAKDKPVLALRLAQESSVDSQLALARTRALKAEQALREVNSGTATLQSESEREHPAPAAPMPPAGTAAPQYQ
jgi:membrane-bound lytic murein transglycosylase